MAAEWEKLVESGKIDPRLKVSGSSYAVIHVKPGVNAEEYAASLVRKEDVFYVNRIEGSAIWVNAHAVYLPFFGQRDEIEKVISTITETHKKLNP